MADVLIFGPGTHAEVRLDASGAIIDIAVRRAGSASVIVIPADWAADLNGSPHQIVADVSASLGGAKVTVVRLIPADD